MSLANHKFGDRTKLFKKAGRVARRGVFKTMQELVSAGKVDSPEMREASAHFVNTYCWDMRVIRNVAHAYC